MGGQRGCRGGLRGPGAAQGCAWYACQVWGGAVTVGPSCARMPNFSVKVGQDEKVAKLVKLVRGPSSGALKAERRCCRTAAILSQRLVSLARQNREQTRREALAAMPQLGGRQFPPHRRRLALPSKAFGPRAGCSCDEQSLFEVSPAVPARAAAGSRALVSLQIMSTCKHSPPGGAA